MVDAATGVKWIAMGISEVEASFFLEYWDLGDVDKCSVDLSDARD